MAKILEENQQFMIHRQGDPIVHPVTGEVLETIVDENLGAVSDTIVFHSLLLKDSVK